MFIVIIYIVYFIMMSQLQRLTTKEYINLKWLYASVLQRKSYKNASYLFLLWSHWNIKQWCCVEHRSHEVLQLINCQWQHTLTQFLIGLWQLFTAFLWYAYRFEIRNNRQFCPKLLKCLLVISHVDQNHVIKLWQICGHLPNSLMFLPANISLYTVA